MVTERELAVRRLANIAQKYDLPFREAYEISNKTAVLHYDGSSKPAHVENAVLCLHDAVVDSHLDFIAELPKFEYICPQYAEALETIDEEVLSDTLDGKIEDTHLTEKGINSLEKTAHLEAGIGLPIHFKYKDREKIKRLESYGITTKKRRSKTGSILSSLAMIGAAIAGATLTKDVHAEDSHKDTGRATSEPVKITDVTDDYGNVIGMTNDDVLWLGSNEEGPSSYYLTNLKTHLTDSFSLDIGGPPPTGFDGKNVVWGVESSYVEEEGELFLYNITTKEKKQLTNDDYYKYDPNILGDKIVYRKQSKPGSSYYSNKTNIEGIWLLDIKTGESRQLVSDLDYGKYSVADYPYFIDKNSIIYLYMPDFLKSLGTADIKKLNILTNSEETILNEVSSSLNYAKDNKLLYENKDYEEYIYNLITGENKELKDLEDFVFCGDSATFVNNSALWLCDLEYLIKDSQPPVLPPVQPASTFIVQLADTHIGAVGADNSLKQVVGKILSFPKKPDYVVVTGDITDFGYSQEGLENFRKFLELTAPLEKAGITVLTVPGNHDYRAKNDLIGSDAYFGSLENLFFNNRLDNYKNSVGDRDLSSKLIISGNCAVMGLDAGYDTLDAAIVSNNNKIGLLPKTSGLKNSQIQWLENTLDNLDGKIDGKDTSGKVKLIFMHAPAYTGILSLGTISQNQKQFLDIVKQFGVNSVYAGHTHENKYLTKDDIRHIQTASAAHDKTWRNISVLQQDGDWRVSIGNPQIYKNTITASTHCPTGLFVRDASGRITPDVESVFAIDGNGSKLSVISVDDRPGLEFEVVGTKDAKSDSTYDIKIRKNSETDNTNPEIYGKELPINKNVVHRYSGLNLDKGSATVKIDANGDGNFEKIIGVDSGKVNPQELELSMESVHPLMDTWYMPAAIASAGFGLAGAGLYLGRGRFNHYKWAPKRHSKLDARKKYSQKPSAVKEYQKPQPRHDSEFEFVRAGKKPKDLESEVGGVTITPVFDSMDADYWYGQAQKQLGNREFRLAEASISKAIALRKDPIDYYLKATINKLQGKNESAQKARDYAKRPEQNTNHDKIMEDLFGNR